ncbi:MAG TPA: leucine-rich repeat domain-containing protein, partial [Nitrosopumilaceae archaeon]|nr:leucine-rich repeat domain-containing protein [Nitrosopumilaceae archaeon]
MTFQFNKDNQELTAAFTNGSQEFHIIPQKIEGGYKYFKLFAWADKIAFELDTEIQIVSTILDDPKNKTVDIFKAGNIEFRKGDMFDIEAILNTDIIILPASSTGTAQPHILNRASELRIPYPTKNDPATVILYNVSGQSLVSGYGYSVESDKSTPEIIETLCKNILSKVGSRIPTATPATINLPLLGTGAGRLEVSQVLNIYDKIFNTNESQFKIIVSILSSNDFNKTIDFFYGRNENIKSPILIERPNIIKELEKEFNIQIESSAYGLNKNLKIIRLNLSDIAIAKNSNLKKLIDLESLNLSKCKVQDVSVFSSIKTLSSLYLTAVEVKDYSFVSKMGNLERLDLSGNNIERIEFLKNIKGIKTLHLKGNKISDIEPLSKFTKLEVLDLS